MKNIHLSGIFGSDITLEKVQQAVGEVGEPLNITINSDGGNLAEAIRITDYLKGLGVPLYASAVNVASAATYLFLNIPAENRTVHPAALPEWFMIHEATAVTNGSFSAGDLRETAENIDEANALLRDLYAEELGITAEEAAKMMADTTFLGNEDKQRYQLAAIKKPVNNENESMNKLQELLKQMESIMAKAVAPVTTAAVPEPESEPEDDQAAEDAAMKDFADRLSALEELVSKLTNANAGLSNDLEAAKKTISEKEKAITAIEAKHKGSINALAETAGGLKGAENKNQVDVKAMNHLERQRFARESVAQMKKEFTQRG